MDRESPDVIEKQMDETRQSLTEKVAALETQVVGTLQTATSTVQDTVQTVQSTVESVKSAVEDTMSTVKGTVEESVTTVTDKVRSAFDLPTHVRSNPWGMMAGAAAAGFVTGLFAFRPQTRPAPAFTPRPAAGVPPVAPVAPPAPTWLDDLMTMAGREARRLGERAITTLAASAQQAIEQEMPRLVSGLADQLPGVVAGFTPPTPAPPAAPPRSAGSFQHYT